MGAAKWIGGVLGMIAGGPLGALAGMALGWIFDESLNSGKDEGAYNNREYDNDTMRQRQAHQQYEGQRNSFLFSMLALSSYIIRADGKVMHSEMELMRRFLRQNFGEIAVSQGEDILLRLFEQQKKMGMPRFRALIMQSCSQIEANMDYSQRLQLLSFLVQIAQADGIVVTEEVNALHDMASYLGIADDDLNSMLNLNNGCSNLDAAYKVLGIASTASDDEVKAAYRKMALKHHPDRVATLGEDVRKAAEKKFQEINEAKEVIYKSRGL